MADILYVYGKNVYVNLTNRCPARCVFCVRNKKEGVGGSHLVLEKEPTADELRAAIDAFSFDGYEELVFCGYGEPTCAVDNLVETARYFKERHSQKIRVDTNGLGCLYNHRDILPEMAAVVDRFSVSLNAPDGKRYDELVRPPYENAFEEVLRFGTAVRELGREVVFSVVSILSEEEIERCRALAADCGIPLKVRSYIQEEDEQ